MYKAGGASASRTRPGGQFFPGEIPARGRSTGKIVEKVRLANIFDPTRSVEVKGRASNFDVLAESEGSQPLIGQVALEILDLHVDARGRKLVPNPASPETPMVEILRILGDGMLVP